MVNHHSQAHSFITHGDIILATQNVERKNNFYSQFIILSETVLLF